MLYSLLSTHPFSRSPFFLCFFSLSLCIRVSSAYDSSFVLLLLFRSQWSRVRLSPARGISFISSFVKQQIGYLKASCYSHQHNQTLFLFIIHLFNASFFFFSFFCTPILRFIFFFLFCCFFYSILKTISPLPPPPKKNSQNGL